MNKTVSKPRNQNINRNNWTIFQLFLQAEYLQCLSLIDKYQQENQNNYNKFLYLLKSQILKKHCDIQSSFDNIKIYLNYGQQEDKIATDIYKSMFLLQKYTLCIQNIEHILEHHAQPNWKWLYINGLCYMNLGNLETAIQQFQKALLSSKNVNMYIPFISPPFSLYPLYCHHFHYTLLHIQSRVIQISKIQQQMNRIDQSIQTIENNLPWNIDDSNLQYILGLLYMRKGNNLKAFQHFGASISHSESKMQVFDCNMAMGSIIQDRNDYKTAIHSYKKCYNIDPNNSQLYNNIGMCFYSEKKYIASISCLKKALYLDPFQWIITYNLGLVSLRIEQYASAFHYFQASIQLKNDFSHSYMNLAIALQKLGDITNADQAFEKALQLDKSDYIIYLNYAIFLAQNQNEEKAKQIYNSFSCEQYQTKSNNDTRYSKQDIEIQIQIVESYFKSDK